METLKVFFKKVGSDKTLEQEIEDIAAKEDGPAMVELLLRHGVREEDIRSIPAALSGSNAKMEQDDHELGERELEAVSGGGNPHPNNQDIILFQKKVAQDFDEHAVAWKVIKNFANGYSHPFYQPFST